MQKPARYRFVQKIRDHCVSVFSEIFLDRYQKATTVIDKSRQHGVKLWVSLSLELGNEKCISRMETIKRRNPRPTQPKKGLYVLLSYVPLLLLIRLALGYDVLVGFNTSLFTTFSTQRRLEIANTSCSIQKLGPFCSENLRPIQKKRGLDFRTNATYYWEGGYTHFILALFI